MINSIGQRSSSSIDASKLRESGKAGTSSSISGRGSSSVSDATPSPVARMAALGAPIDIDKVAQIKAAIARGEYPVDATAIADRMVELDLPVRSY